MPTLTMLLSALGAATALANGPSAAPEPKTPEAVIAVDRAWSDAETRGDEAYVDWLLTPGYRSVGPDGKVATKEMILRSARLQTDPAKAAARAAAVAEWRATHPVRGDVAIVDDTAVLTWVSTKPGGSEPVSSCDIFVYQNGHWRGVYSQHSSASA